MYDPSSFANPTPLAHADTSRDVLPRVGSSATLEEAVSPEIRVRTLFLFLTSSPQNPGAELFALSSIISLIGPEAGTVLHHLKLYAFTELFNARTFLTHPTIRNFTTSGQGQTHIKIPSRFRGDF
ncbi:hypothetical protein TNCV_4458641 [Trichonephila clavipes]|nr:hypothetical protein TNCV_4458641 [Trichonephila clavipes]